MVLAEKKQYDPAISAEKMSYGLIGGVSVAWLISVIVSISSLFSLTYIRYHTELIRRAVIPVSCQPIGFNDYELVHIDCPIRTNAAAFKIPKQFAGVVDTSDLASAVFFEMSMEMFQNGRWYDHILSSANSRATAAYFPSLDGVGRQFANAVYAGNFLLDPATIPNLFHQRRPVRVIDSGLFTPDSAKPPLKLTDRNTHAYNNALYTAADPAHPDEGDLRIQFFVNSATHVSAIGIQSHLPNSYPSAILKWLDESLPHLRGRGTVRALLPKFDAELNQTDFKIGPDNHLIMAEGDHDADQLLAIYEAENNAFAPIHWYAIGMFGLSTTAITWISIRRCSGLDTSAGPVLVIAGVFLTFGSTLLLASIPNIIMKSTWRLGFLQFIAGTASTCMSYWSLKRAPEIYRNSCLGSYDQSSRPQIAGYTPLRSEPLMARVDEGTEVMMNELPKMNNTAKSYAAV